MDLVAITKNKIKGKTKKKNSFIKKVMRSWGLLIMLLPGALFLLVNNYIPMLGVIIAFKKVNYVDGILGSPFVGLKNFEFLFRSADAFIITRNTVLYNCAFIIVNLVLGVALAIGLNEVKNRRAAKIYQNAIFLPYFLSYVVISYIVFAFLNGEYGLLNRTILPAMGLNPISWYMEAKYWPVILIFVSTWKGIGYTSVVYLASITGIDESYYEAAVIDGANKWEQIINITIPQLIPLMVIMTLLAIGRIFYGDFGLFYQVPRDIGTLYSTTNVIDTYVYRALTGSGQIGMASAAGLYQSLVGFILVISSNIIVKKYDKDYALF